MRKKDISLSQNMSCFSEPRSQQTILLFGVQTIRSLVPCVSTSISAIKRQCHSFSGKLLEIQIVAAVSCLGWRRGKRGIKYHSIVELQNHVGWKGLQGGSSWRDFITEDRGKDSGVPQLCLGLLSLNHSPHSAMVPHFHCLVFS